MSDAPKINTNWREQERDVLQKCHAGDIDDFLAQVGDKKMTVEQIHLASTHVAHRILAEKHNEMLRSRNQWRECAEKLADASRNMLCGWRYLQAASGHMRVVGWEPAGDSASKAIAEFERLKDDSK